MLGGGGAGGLGLDLSAVIQAAVVGLVIFSAAVVAVRCAASRYIVYLMEQGQAAAMKCAACGSATITNKKCARCKRVRYCSKVCQAKHWDSDHRFECKPVKLSVPADKLSCGGQANSKKSSGFSPISLVPSSGKLNKVIFPYDEFLKLYNWKDLDFLPCGLFNCGNSCFANVVLQCLSCTRPLAAYLLGKNHARECYRRHEDWCFLCELQCHIQRASESLHPFAPMNILSHLPSIGGNLGFGRQEDAHEFMRFAIDKMQSACLDEFGGEKAVDLSTQETTLIQHIFGGRLQSQVQCTTCGMVSNRYESMMDLTVEIQGDAGSLEECLDQFTAVEWLDGDNKYKCDGCSAYVKARKCLTVHQAPNVLTVTLKRFQSGRFGKLNKRVTFPMKLDLTPYMSSTDGNDLYDLYAVVVHLDMLNASFFGHYICYTKDYRGCWYKIDDCKVMVVDEEEVHAQGAYMLLYSRRTARPWPLIAVEELLKQQQQCKVLPLNGQNRFTPEDVSLNCDSSLKPSEDVLVDGEFGNKSFHKLDTMDQKSDLDLHVGIARDKSTNNENLHPSVSTVLHVLDEDTVGSDVLLDGCSTMRSVQFGNSSCELSSAHSSADQCEESASCIDPVDYMDVDTEAGMKSERWSEQQPVLGDSVEVMGNRTVVPTLENGLTVKETHMFSPGFSNKPLRKKSSFAEECQIDNNGADSSCELNGHCSGDLHCSDQVVLASRGNTSFGRTQCHGNHSLVNGDTKSSNYSLRADQWDVSPGRNIDRTNASNGKPSEDLKKSSRYQQAKDCQDDMSFLHRGFLQRHNSRETPVKGDDGLPSSNGTLTSFLNGNTKPSNSSSRNAKGGTPLFSRGFFTKPYLEPRMKTFSNMSMEQKVIGGAVCPDQMQERLSSDSTGDGTLLQQRAASVDNVSGHPDENGHAVLGNKNSSYVEENGSNGILDMDGNSYKRDVASTVLVSEKGIGSENADHLKFISATLDHDGLRQRLISKFPEQNGIDAQ